MEDAVCTKCLISIFDESHERGWDRLRGGDAADQGMW